jgi:VWFA-related protein
LRLVCTLLLAVPVLAQEAPAVFTADSRLVVLHATVVDKDGKHLLEVPRSAFRVFEDGVEQQLKIFRREDVPVSMGLLVDNSGSMRGKRQKVEAAALALVKASNRQDEVFIVNFNDEPYRDVEFTSDVQKLTQGLARIDARGGTAMRDAVHQSILYARGKGRRDKKVLIVVTDGNDNMSGATLEEIMQQAQQAEILVYAIGLLSEEERKDAREARRALDAIAKATGGEAFYPETADEVGEIALRVAQEIRSQYILGYTPTNQALDGTYRRVRVTVRGRGRAAVRTRTGYYATAELARRP